MTALTKLFKDFTNSEKSSGFVLIFTTIFSLILTNFIAGDSLNHFYHSYIGSESIGLKLSVEHWVNDGLMAIFFLLVGLEIEREIYIGELSSLKSASLPIVAAIGGMLIPFLVHFMLNYGTPTQDGGGIPMATDIAFALGILSLAKNIPNSLKVFLTAFAIIDDLGAIIIIAFFYTESIKTIFLIAAFVLFVVMIVLNRLKVYKIWPYLILGAFMWYCFLQSGVHATISGVLLAFAMPFGNGDEQSPSYRLQHWLHKPVAFVILPIFALVNTGILITDTWLNDLATTNSLGILLGLVIGKPIGIMLFCFVGVKLGLSVLPDGMKWGQLLGAGFLGGIGFTMSIFISLLAFTDSQLVTQSKMAILISSVTASVIALIILSIVQRNAVKQDEKGYK